MIYIYTLEDRDGNIRYVGQTVNLYNRLLDHCKKSSLKKKNHKNNWIKSLLIKNERPSIHMIDMTDCNGTANELEVYWISQLKVWNFDLVNSTEGGSKDCNNRKGCKLSEEHKLKISKSTRGVKKPIDFGENMRRENNPFFGKKHTKEALKKISRAAKLNMTEERKRFISERVKLAMQNPIIKQKMISNQKDSSGNNNPMYGKKGKDNPNFGRKNSEETKRKMSEAAKRRWNKI